MYGWIRIRYLMASPRRGPTGESGSLACCVVFAKRGAVVAILAALELKSPRAAFSVGSQGLAEPANDRPTATIPRPWVRAIIRATAPTSILFGTSAPA